jgi:outer membrane lipoprotein-sorting protein
MVTTLRLLYFLVLSLSLRPQQASAADPELAAAKPEVTAAKPELASVDVTAILAKIDANLTYEGRTSQITMTVVTARRTRVYKMRTHGRGQTEAAVEYLAPARDKGTRLLKQDKELWLYMPTIERTQKISGHMLRQGMMGSDVSYEDMMNAQSFLDLYEVALLGEETLGERSCWKLSLTARDDSISYPTRTAWVDKGTFIPIKQELFALSGMLLKTWSMTEVQTFADGRRFPTRMELTDELKKGSKTTIELTELVFKLPSNEQVFSRRWLERGL